MTVRIITETQKNVIAHQYSFIKVPVKDLAKDYNVSTRTIQRVLVEKGLNRVRMPKDIPVLTTQIVLPGDNKTPRAITTIKTFLKSIFRNRSPSSNAQTFK